MPVFGSVATKAPNSAREECLNKLGIRVLVTSRLRGSLKNVFYSDRKAYGAEEEGCSDLSQNRGAIHHEEAHLVRSIGVLRRIKLPIVFAVAKHSQDHFFRCPSCCHEISVPSSTFRDAFRQQTTKSDERRLIGRLKPTVQTLKVSV